MARRPWWLGALAKLVERDSETRRAVAELVMPGGDGDWRRVPLTIWSPQLRIREEDGALELTIDGLGEPLVPLLSTTDGSHLRLEVGFGRPV